MGFDFDCFESLSPFFELAVALTVILLYLMIQEPISSSSFCCPVNFYCFLLRIHFDLKFNLQYLIYLGLKCLLNSFLIIYVMVCLIDDLIHIFLPPEVHEVPHNYQLGQALILDTLIELSLRLGQLNQWLICQHRNS